MVPRLTLDRAEASAPTLGDFDLVVALVEFQSDSNRFTTGSGTFAGPLFDDGLAPRLDPLPHDSSYFDAHLQFLKHYVSRVSDGAASVNTHILPGIVTVSQAMDSYSPIGLESDSDEQLGKLAALVSEVWQLADENIQYDVSSFDPQRTAFAFFHAGVGRDIELIGTTLDKTPLDLPSLYFGPTALSRLLPDGLPTFKGLTVSSTIVLPRTETRVGTNFITDSRFLAEFSINGLIAASFFNYLGVPDLFNTKDGTSAIGPFGLMDPLGIFAFNGLFPPEPSAWTKSFLGWSTEVDPVDGMTSLTAVSDVSGSDVRKVAISESEYFLIENRNRDPEGDGLILDVYTSDGIVQQRFSFDDESFNSRTIEGFEGGVVVGVDNYDWALPGGADTEGIEYRGGALVWHIDERIIRSSLATNSVNADPEARGIDLEEADSAVDLGFPPLNPFAPPFDLGTPFDYFYEGNPVTVVTATGTEIVLYENRFGGDTFPNSNNNGGGPSFIELGDFSPPGMTMTFEERQNRNSVLIPEEGFVSRSIGSTQRDGLILPFGSGQQFVAVQSSQDDSVHVYSVEEGLQTSVGPGLIAGTSTGQLLVLQATGTDGVTLSLLPDDSVPLTIAMPAGLNTTFLKGPLVTINDSTFAAAYTSDAERGLVTFEPGGSTFTPVDQAAGGLVSVALTDSDLIVFGTDGLYSTTQAVTTLYGQISDQSSTLAARDDDGTIAAAFSPDNRSLTLVQNGSVTQVDLSQRFSGNSLSQVATLVPVDFDSNGIVEFLVTYGREAIGISKNGTVVDGFPVEFSADIVASPMVYTSDGRMTLVVSTSSGYLYEYANVSGSRWEVLPGFPLSAGDAISVTPAMTEDRIVTVSAEGEVMSYERQSPVEVIVGQRWLSSGNTSFVDVARGGQIDPTGEGIIDNTETYVWPNPVREGVGNLRVGASRDCTVTVTIIDRAGRQIDEIEIGEVRAGIPSERIWTTDAGSGIYYGRITARFASGSEEHQIIKIAVIR
ncbi:MAG: hypothetical protein HKN43_09055 [Rhodothermales bacterium]|nr:hypothetical protein [Rhodothermales bacterium]